MYVDWSEWIARDVAVPDETAPDRAMDVIRHAWDQVTGARLALRDGDYLSGSYGIRRAMGSATRALLLGQGLRPLDDERVVRLARRTCVHAFGTYAQEVFDKADEFAGALPFPPQPTAAQLKLSRRGLAAAAQIVSLVESHVYR